jgi:hypothetical protein
MSLPAVAALLQLFAPTPVPPPLKLYSTTEDNEAPAAFAPGGAADPCGRVATSYSYDVAVRPSLVRNRNSRDTQLFTYDYCCRHSGIASPARLRSAAPIVMIYGAPLGVTPERGVAQRDRCTYDSRPRTFATQGPVPRNTATDAPAFTAPDCRVPASGYSYGAPPVRLWLSRDPIGEKGGFNLYEYVNNNSVNLVDPLGLYVPAPAAPALLNPVVAGTVATVGVLAASGYGYWKLGELVGDTIVEWQNRRPWKCEAKCQGRPTKPCAICPDWVYGSGSGSTLPAAEKAAINSAQNASPVGCYTRHCYATNCWQ